MSQNRKILPLITFPLKSFCTSQKYWTPIDLPLRENSGGFSPAFSSFQIYFQMNHLKIVIFYLLTGYPFSPIYPESNRFNQR